MRREWGEGVIEVADGGVGVVWVGGGGWVEGC